MKIRFMSQENAERLIPHDSMAIISIVGKDSPPRKLKNWKNRLYLYFDDIVMKMKDRKEFDNNDANKIKEFIKHLPSDVNIIIVHCHQGVSRSAAVAKWLNEYYKTRDFPLMYMAFNPLVYNVLKRNK